MANCFIPSHSSNIEKKLSVLGGVQGDPVLDLEKVISLPRGISHGGLTAGTRNQGVML